MVGGPAGGLGSVAEGGGSLVVDGRVGLETLGIHCDDEYVGSRNAVVMLRTLLSGLMVLVVDDDQACREVMELFLGDLGARVRTAHCGVNALLMVHEHQPDLVLTDLTMPGMSGADLLTYLRRIHSPTTLPVVAVSGWGNQGDAEQFDGPLDKPFDYNDLLGTLEQIFQLRPALLRQQCRRLRGKAAHCREDARLLRDRSAVALHRSARFRASS